MNQQRSRRFRSARDAEEVYDLPLHVLQMSGKCHSVIPLLLTMSIFTDPNPTFDTHVHELAEVAT